DGMSIRRGQGRGTVLLKLQMHWVRSWMHRGKTKRVSACFLDRAPTGADADAVPAPRKWSGPGAGPGPRSGDAPSTRCVGPPPPFTGEGSSASVRQAAQEGRDLQVVLLGLFLHRLGRGGGADLSAPSALVAELG